MDFQLTLSAGNTIQRLSPQIPSVLSTATTKTVDKQDEEVSLNAGMFLWGDQQSVSNVAK